MKTSKVMWDVRVYRSIELDSDPYLSSAKVNFPPLWLNNNIKKVPVKQKFFKIGLSNNENKRWHYTQGVELYSNNTKRNETDVEKE
jgi:hypothetical protein